MKSVLQIVFWLMFGINALVSPLMFLMGLNAWAFNVRHELLWSELYFLGMALALYFQARGMRAFAFAAIIATSLLCLYVRSRIGS